MATPNTPLSSPAPNASDVSEASDMALALQQAPLLTIGDQVFGSKNDIISYINSLPPAERYGVQKTISTHLLKAQATHEDLIFEFYQYAEASKAYEQADLSRKEFLEDNEAFIAEVNNIKAKRDVRKESLKRLDKQLTSQRGLSLLKTIEEDRIIAGKNFVADLANIFGKVGVREGVAHLNMAILARNRRPKTKGMRPRAAITAADAAAAKGRVTKKEGFVEEDVSLEDLQQMGLMYSTSGLLVEGPAKATTHPAFADEAGPAAITEGAESKDQSSSSPVEVSSPVTSKSTIESISSPIASVSSPIASVSSPTTSISSLIASVSSPVITNSALTSVSSPLTNNGREMEGTPTPTQTVTPDMTLATPQKRGRSPSPPDASPSAKRIHLEVDNFASPYTAVPNTGECDCHMDIGWKNAIEHPPAVTTFKELRELIRPAIEAEDQPCLWHVVHLCTQLRLRTEDLDAATMISRLREIWDRSAGDSTNVRVISSSCTYPYFIECDEFKHIRASHNLGVFKFAPVVQTSGGVQKAQLVPKSVSEAMRVALGENDWASFRGFYSWAKPLHDIFIEEANMYAHHLRTAPTSSGLIPNMYYSLAQQLFRQDPALYEVHVSLRQDRETRLLAVPHCARFFDDNTTADASLYEGNTRQIRLGASCAIQDEIVVTREQHAAEVVEVLQQSAPAVRAWLEANDEHRDTIDTITPADISPGLAWHKVKTPHDLVCTTAGTPVRYRFVATTPRLSITSGLVAVSATDPTLLEDGTPVAEIVQCHRRMTVPEQPRSASGGPGNVPVAFPPAIDLTDLGAISNAMVGRMDWDSPTVEEERRLILTGDKDSVIGFYKSWRKRAIGRVRKCWELVQEREQKFYGAKSYFANRDREYVDLTADDEVFEAPAAAGDGEAAGPEIPDSDDINAVLDGTEGQGETEDDTTEDEHADRGTGSEPAGHEGGVQV